VEELVGVWVWYCEYPITKFPIFYGTRKFLTASANARHLSVY